jgi:hypothetical protein
MGVFYEDIPESLIPWILEQKLFWVATAPLSGQMHINVSPKGGEYFGVLDSKTFWYMELTGSGSETISHLHEPGNGRITIMLNAFDGPPKILRLWGKGEPWLSTSSCEVGENLIIELASGTCLENGSKEFEDFIEKHNVKTVPGTRSIIVVDVHQVGSSCGFSVPYFDFKGHRDILNDFFRKKQEKFDAGKESESIARSVEWPFITEDDW